MNMRFVAIVALVSLAFTPELLNACSCMPHDQDPVKAVQKSFDRADVVFLGQAESVETTDSDSESYVDIFQTTTFYVIKAWKGEESKRILTRINIACCLCGYAFEEGRKYLVFGYKLDDGFYSTSTCGLTTTGERADEFAAILDELAHAQ
jgi:hypothetical protein